MTSTLRILHLPDVIGGHPPALAAGERARGAQSKTLCYDPSPYGYAADIMLGGAGVSQVEKVRQRWQAFRDVRDQYDVFHFNFGASLLHMPRLGAILPEVGFYGASSARFMTFQGDDARLAYPLELDASIAEEKRRGRWSGPDSHADYVDRLRLAKRRMTIWRAAKSCDHIFALNPDLLAHLPAEKSSFLPYAIDPLDGAQYRAAETDTRQTRPLRLVHLSTSPVIKGSGLIENAVAEAAKHCAVELDIVIQQPRPEALRRLAAADYMIDQLVLGWYGGTVVEAMYLGVPCIGRIDPTYAARVPELANELPVVRADAATLAQTIVELSRDPGRRAQLSAAGRTFAKKWHAPETVARTTIAAYEAALSVRRSSS